MSILNVNNINPVGSGRTITVNNAVNGSAVVDITGSLNVAAVDITGSLNVAAGDINGEVGIGTDTNLTAKLTVGNIENTGVTNKGATAFKTLNSSGGVGEAAIYLEEQSGNEGWYLKVNSSGDLQFNDSGASDRITFQDGGNVGIGTENPTEKLEIRDGGLLINESNLTGIFTGDVADDTFVSIDLTQPGFIAGGLFLITTNSGATNAGVFPQAIGTGLVYYDCGNSLAGARILADADAGGSALLGGTTSTSTTITDFTDGRVTIICNTNTLRIANRTGGNRRFKLTFV